MPAAGTDTPGLSVEPPTPQPLSAMLRGYRLAEFVQTTSAVQTTSFVVEVVGADEAPAAASAPRPNSVITKPRATHRPVLLVRIGQLLSSCGVSGRRGYRESCHNFGRSEKPVRAAVRRAGFFRPFG